MMNFNTKTNSIRKNVINFLRGKPQQLDEFGSDKLGYYFTWGVVTEQKIGSIIELDFILVGLKSAKQDNIESLVSRLVKKIGNNKILPEISVHFLNEDPLSFKLVFDSSNHLSVRDFLLEEWVLLAIPMIVSELTGTKVISYQSALN